MEQRCCYRQRRRWHTGHHRHYLHTRTDEHDPSLLDLHWLYVSVCRQTPLCRDINQLILDALKGYRRKLSRQGNKGRRRKRGRPSKAQQRRRKKANKTAKDKAHFIYKNRHLIVKRRHKLTPEERRRAVVLIESLRRGRDLILAGERDGDVVLRAMASRVQETPGATLDYVAVVNAETLEPLERTEGKVLMALAVRIGTTRLIDNLLMRVTAEGAREMPVPE